MVDPKIEAFGTMETRLHQLVGLRYTAVQECDWRSRVAVRAQRSVYRSTVEHKRKRKLQRKMLTEKRGKAKTDHAYKYKGQTGGPARGNGAAGACTCAGQCVRNCPCKAASPPQLCGEACHPSKACKNVAAGASSGDNNEEELDATGPLLSGDDLLVAQPEPPPLDASLVDTTIMFHFDGVGWCQGVVMEQNEDEEQMDDEDIANFIVYYEGDDSETAHHLTILDYFANSDAPPGAWYALRRQ